MPSLGGLGSGVRVTLGLFFILVACGFLTQGAGALAGWPVPLASLGRLWIHQNWLHLIGNGLGLLVLGTALEQRCGGRVLLIVWLASGLAGACLSYLLDPSRISLGASGSVYGLAGALLVTTWRGPAASPWLLRLILLGLMLSGLQATKMGWPVDRPAHAGGAVAGIMLGWLLVKPSFARQSDDSSWPSGA